MMTGFGLFFSDVMLRRRSVLLVTTVLVGMAIVPAMTGHAATTSGKSGWTTTKVPGAGGAAAYCALSRQVDETTLTVGRTVKGQSSLALEMKSAKLDPARTYRLSVKAGNAERVEIEAKPLNARTFVLNMDDVIDLAASFSASPTLQVRYDDNALALTLANWDRAAKEMEKCLADLSPKGEKLAATAPAQGDIAVVPRTPDEVDRTSDKLLAFDDAPQKEILEPAPVKSKTKSSPVNSENNDVARLRDELATLKASREADRAASQSQETTRQNLAMRLSTLEAENEKLRSDLRARDMNKEKDSDAREQIAKMNADFDAREKAMKDEITQLTSVNAGLMKEKDAQKTESADVGKLRADLDKAKADLTAALAAKNLLQTKLDEAQKGTTAALKSPDLQLKLDKAQAEVDMLRTRLAQATDAAKLGKADELQRKIESLSAENIKLRGDLAAATTPENDMKVSVAAEAPLRQQLRDMRDQNASLRGQVDELTALLDRAQSRNDKSLIAASGKNWDLEQATRRLQESDREVARLSLSLRDQKTQCDAQKKEIEYMLFDPKLAKEGQIALLNSLEDQIAALKSAGAAVAVASNHVAQNVADITPASAETTETPVLTEASVVKNEALAAPAATANVTDTSSPAGITGLLKQAGIAMTKAVAPVAKNPFGSGKAFAWETDTLAGMAVQQTGVKDNAFDGQISQQLKRMKSMCRGDFAAQPATETGTKSGGLLHYAAYDAACIAGANSTSAALLFYQKDGSFNVISHETAPDEMANAMDARDRLITTLAGE